MVRVIPREIGLLILRDLHCSGGVDGKSGKTPHFCENFVYFTKSGSLLTVDAGFGMFACANNFEKGRFWL